MRFFQSPEHQPPRLADRFLSWYCHPDLIEEIQGDLYEDYINNIQEIGERRAKRIFSWHVLLFFRLSNIKKITLNFSTMLWRNHIKISFRNMWKYKGFTLLNALGLTVGLATAIMILLWIKDEVAFDKFHANDEQLYRIMRNMHLDGGTINTTQSLPMPLARALEEKFPEVEGAVAYSWNDVFLVSHEEKTFRRNGHFAGTAFFDHLSFPFLAGNPSTALEGVKNVVISNELAKQLYGNDWQTQDDIIGKPLKVGFGEFDLFTLTGVFEDVPGNSTLQFDLIVPRAYFEVENTWTKEWTNNGFRMFVKLKEGTDATAFNDKIKNVIRENAPNEEVDLFIQPFSDQHLYSQFENGTFDGGRINYVRIFSFVAIFILLIACINFINLATARSSKLDFSQMAKVKF